ncbi:TPA: YacC family pilotin-like protein [Yersinia enterocolitica]
MKRTTLVMLLLTLCGFSSASSALSESEAEDLADLTAVFVYLKNDCGYNELPNNEIKRAIVYFAQQNRWDLRNYNSFNMKALGEESYRDLRGIAIPVPTKCKYLARDSLSLLAYAN